MLSRGLLLSLALSLSAPALAEVDEGVTVSVHCMDPCAVVLDGKPGRAVNESLWEFPGIAPGAHRVEAVDPKGQPLVSGLAEIPDTAQANVYLISNERIVTRKGGPPEPGTPEWEREVARITSGTPPSTHPPPPQMPPEKSTVIVRCQDDCSVVLDGRRGLRRDALTWEFRNVEPGKHRIEGIGELLLRRLFLVYVDVPSGMELTYQGESKNLLRLTKQQLLTSVEAARAKAGLTESSRLHVRCPKSCTVRLDGARKGEKGGSGVVIQDVPFGQHTLEASFSLSDRNRRLSLNVPPRSEVFITASADQGIVVTNTRPIGFE
ncbi:hypothetical protein NVS55_00065 [Myxococcus stipitatus]|uniref:hypothetical protein n=1 Tax=Myxococcus stipitatus TaxID=83455 RepID=UPI003144D449